MAASLSGSEIAILFVAASKVAVRNEIAWPFESTREKVGSPQTLTGGP
jgi:hypothetical protein